MKNLVSTILCCHKLDHYLYSSIESILNQDYSNFELIIVFDNSSSNQFDKLKNHFIKHPKYKKISFYKNNQNLGLTKSLNIGITKAKGYYIMRQDSDDISKINRISKLVNYLNNNKNKSLVFSNVDVINDQGKLIKKKINYLIINSFYNSYNYRNSISHPSIMFTKDIYNKVKGYDERFIYSQDYDFISNIIKIDSSSIGKINFYLYKLRYQKNSISSNYSLLQRQNSIIIILKKSYTFFYNNLNNMKSTEEMFNFITNNLKKPQHKAIYYGYLYEKKIDNKLLFSPIFLIKIIFLFLNHPNLLINRIKN